MDCCALHTRCVRLRLFLQKRKWSPLVGEGFRVAKKMGFWVSLETAQADRQADRNKAKHGQIPT